jgi:beta-N-acetylhexosaminidase
MIGWAGPAIAAVTLPMVMVMPFGTAVVIQAPSVQQRAAAVYGAMSPAQRVGQLMMIGVETTHVTAAAISQLKASHVGNIILNGNSHRGLSRTAKTTARLDADFTVKGAAPLISTDQEGGEVQRLTGSGFSTMPSALAQGRQSTATLRSESKTWGSQLAKAGISLDLAPVADTVPKKNASRNQPIGRYDREFGHQPSNVGRHVAAFVTGMSSAGVDVTVKHFPGLGRATGNTDVQKTVTDPTTRHDPYLAPYQSGIDAGAQFVMVSLATYPNIDPSRPACFSPTIMKSMLRKQLGFSGVIISDSMNALAVSGVTTGSRAVRFFRNGGTMLLDTNPAHAAAMQKAVLTQMSASTAFASTIKSDVLKVLQAKENLGLLAG